MILMGFTFLEAGTSVPDLITTVIVARMSEGDMTLSSSIGRNIFVIFFGLPVTWTLYCLIGSKPNFVTVRMNEKTQKKRYFLIEETHLNFSYFFYFCHFLMHVKIGTKGMGTSIIMLLDMVLSIIFIIHFNGWKHTKSLGFIMLILCVIYLAQAVIR